MVAAGFGASAFASTTFASAGFAAGAACFARAATRFAGRLRGRGPAAAARVPERLAGRERGVLLRRHRQVPVLAQHLPGEDRRRGEHELALGASSACSSAGSGRAAGTSRGIGAGRPASTLLTSSPWCAACTPPGFAGSTRAGPAIALMIGTSLASRVPSRNDQRPSAATRARNTAAPESLRTPSGISRSSPPPATDS